MPEDETSPLTFATNAELIDELARRSDGLALTALFKADDEPEGGAMTFRYTGGIWQALGLLAHASATLHKQINESDADE